VLRLGFDFGQAHGRYFIRRGSRRRAAS
jgi:hypothetical protein